MDDRWGYVWRALVALVMLALMALACWTYFVAWELNDRLTVAEEVLRVQRRAINRLQERVWKMPKPAPQKE